jgi:hypothetical protein
MPSPVMRVHTRVAKLSTMNRRNDTVQKVCQIIMYLGGAGIVSLSPSKHRKTHQIVVINLIKVVVDVVIVVAIILVFHVHIIKAGRHEAPHGIFERGSSKTKVDCACKIKGIIFFIIIHIHHLGIVLLLLLPRALDSSPGRPWRGIVHDGCRATTPIDRYDGVLGDLSLADRALTVVGVDMEPLIKAFPAEEVAALGDDRFCRHVKADVTLEVGGVAVPLVVRLLVTTDRSHGPGDGRLVRGCDRGRMTHLCLAGGGGGGRLFRSGGVAMSGVDRAVAIVGLRGRPTPWSVPSPPAAAAAATAALYGVAGIATVRKASPSGSPAGARGIDPAGHGNGSDRIG